MSQIQAVVTRTRKPRPLPPWTVTFAFILKFLREQQLLEEIAKRAAIYRKGGYVGFDFLIAALAYFVAPPSGGIKGFCKSIKRFAADLAIQAVVMALPGSSSLSRILGSADRLENAEEFVCWLLAEASGCRDLLRSKLVQARDATGKYWSVFDFDPTVLAIRLRALAECFGLPEAIRRGIELFAPGYCARKRGDTQLSTAMLSHAGSGLWLHASVWPGNTPFAEAIDLAAKQVARVAKWAGLDAVLLRFDGAGGHHSAIAAVAAWHVSYLTRLGCCAVLKEPGVAAHLAMAVWLPVVDSGSGPRREATDLGSYALSKGEFRKETKDSPALRVRLVVSRFPAVHDGKRHGAGIVIGDWHYEVFATDLNPVAWPAADTVTLYYGRCGQENAFAQCGSQLRLGKVHAMTVAGQRLMTVVGMWVANLQRVLAVMHQGDLGEVPAQEKRPTAESPVEAAPTGEVTAVFVAAESVSPALPAEPAAEPAAVAQPDMAAAADIDPEVVQPSIEVSCETETPAVETLVVAANTAPPVTAEPTPAAATDARMAALKARVVAGVAADIRCPAGLLLPLQGFRFIQDQYAYASYRGSATTCGTCTTRKQCTVRSDGGYRREISVRIPSWWLTFRHELLQLHRSARQKALACPVTPILPAPTVPPEPALPPPLSAPVVPPPKPEVKKASRLILAQAEAPGPLLPAGAALYMPALTEKWHNYLAGFTVQVEIRQPKAPPARRDWIRATAAQRQCRRKTWDERRAFNASFARIRVTFMQHVGEVA